MLFEQTFVFRIPFFCNQKFVFDVFGWLNELDWIFFLPLKLICFGKIVNRIWILRILFVLFAVLSYNIFNERPRFKKFYETFLCFLSMTYGLLVNDLKTKTFSSFACTCWTFLTSTFIVIKDEWTTNLSEEAEVDSCNKLSCWQSFMRLCIR